jgi:thiol-disulfide isomerase/thioredoxin
MKIIAILLLSFSQKDIVLTGHLPFLAGRTIEISGAHHFSHSLSADDHGRFNLRFNADTGYYKIDDGSHPITVYLEPGMQLDIRKKGEHLDFGGTGGMVNRLLDQRDSLLKVYLPIADNTLSDRANLIDPNDFTNELENYRSATLRLLANGNLSPYFLRTQTDETDCIVRFYTQLYATKYGIDPKKESDFFEKYNKLLREDSSKAFGMLMSMQGAIRVKQLSAKDILRLDAAVWKDFNPGNDALYQFSAAYRQLIDLWLGRYAFFAAVRVTTLADIYKNKIDLIKAHITNAYIREDLLYQLTKRLLEVAGKDTGAYYTDYLNSTTDTIDAGTIRNIHEKLLRFTSGALAPTFAYPDIHDQPVRLETLQGHYVYIDVWATWCGPCKAELPYLKVLEKKYSGRNIQFVGISVDRAQDAGSWKKFVADNDLKGWQVMADHDFSSSFITDFNITSIPRFILLDPAGRIVSENAERPSDPALVLLLDKLLSE